MKLYVTRHGQTELNVKRKVCGLTNIPLTEKGKAQAKALSAKLATKKIDLIICSPLKRARMTAEIINESTHCNIIVDDRIIEQNYGVYEKTDWDDEKFLAAKKAFFCKFPGGESIVQVAHRAYNLLDEIKEKYDGKTILIVSHGGVCRVIDTYFNDRTNNEFFDFQLDNCGLKEYEL